MEKESEPRKGVITDRLDQPDGVPQLETKVTYRPVPHSATAENAENRAVWRVRFDLASDRSVSFGLEINDNIVFGRGDEKPNAVDLSEYGAGDLGVSREHIALRPTPTNLYVVDMGSTNGTLRNGRSIGVKTPHSLTNGDTLSLGQLQFVVRIVKRPKGQTANLYERADLGEALAQIARALTSQLKIEEVLNQVVDLAMSLTSAGESAVWLMDDETNELYLEAERGIEAEEIKRLRIPVNTDTLAGQVIESGEVLRAKRTPEGDQVKVKTGYLVDALIYVPLKLGGETLGVLAVAHREGGKEFSERDEKLLAAIGDFAAIAVQNSRLFESTDEALQTRVKELAALNELSAAVSSSLDIGTVHDVLIQQIAKHWNVESTSLWMVNSSARQLARLSDIEPNGGRGTLPPVELGRGIIGKVAHEGQALYINNVQNDPDFDANIDQFDDITAQSMLCVPLIVKTDVVGVLTLTNKKEGNFTDEDIDRLQAFALPVATAIENGRLFAESERERATVRATANALPQPLMILDEDGQLVISNEAANSIVDNFLPQLFDGLSSAVGSTTQISLGEQAYISSVEHEPNVGTIIVMQDMTYVKKLEQARAEFVYALSHDLKGPLASIKGYSQLVLKASGDVLDEQSTMFVGRVVDSSDRMLGMINQLLDIALLTEAPQANHSPVELRNTVETALKDLEGAADARSIKLALEVEGKAVAIKGDAQRLYRSMLNLIDNAVKYSEDGSEVLVKLSYASDDVIITVQDSGPGIPEEDLPHIFDKYYRGKRERGSGSGIGLGLVMVQSTVEMHDGTIEARNREPKGAEFEITLPASLRIA